MLRFLSRRPERFVRRRWLVMGLIGVALSYVALLAVAATQYRRFLYPAPTGPGGAIPPQARLVEARASDGVAVHALFYEPRAAAAVVVLFHGNGETAFDNVWKADELAARGLGVMLVEYRGYGRSHREAAPTEEGLYADASGALDWLSKRGIGADRVVLWGQSLGSGVAAEMALRKRARALVLVCPYTSIVDMARRHAPGWLPVNLVVGDRFDTASKAPHIALPTLVIHGDADELIPHAMSQQLASLLPQAKLLTIRGGHHNDLVDLERRTVFDAVANLARL